MKKEGVGCSCLLVGWLVGCLLLFAVVLWAQEGTPLFFVSVFLPSPTFFEDVISQDSQPHDSMAMSCFPEKGGDKV
jgi:hypothetical protein